MHEPILYWTVIPLSKSLPINPSDINVLVACEESQRVCIAFRERGFNAFSCDLQPCSGGHPEWHMIGDVMEILNPRYKTPYGTLTPKWHLIIAHPPCTYLTNAGNRSFVLDHTPAEKVIDRWEKRTEAVVFFLRLYYADCPLVCVENPVGWMNHHFIPPTQTIHPWMFAESEEDTENYKNKRTSLWLKGLPPLQGNPNIKPFDCESQMGRNKSGKVRSCVENLRAPERQKARSKTFPAVAKAMAKQWGDFVLKYYERNGL